MAHAIDHDDPEHMIAVMNRNRYIKTVLVVAGMILAFTMLIAASAAMYSEDPAAKVLSTPEK